MAMTQAQFDALLTSLQTVVTNDDSLINQAIALIQALIAKGQANGVDFTAEGAQVTALTTDLQNQGVAIQAAITAANPPPAAS